MLTVAALYHFNRLDDTAAIRPGLTRLACANGVKTLIRASVFSHYVAPQDWNELIVSPDTVVIDTRDGHDEFDISASWMLSGAGAGTTAEWLLADSRRDGGCAVSEPR